jgi:hypothetical protein
MGRQRYFFSIEFFNTHSFMHRALATANMRKSSIASCISCPGGFFTAEKQRKGVSQSINDLSALPLRSHVLCGELLRYSYNPKCNDYFCSCYEPGYRSGIQSASEGMLGRKVRTAHSNVPVKSRVYRPMLRGMLI